jgi:hypothetical protein
LRWWDVYVVDVRGGLVFFGERPALAVPTHDAFAADHCVCDVFGAIAFWQARVLAHWAEAGVVAEESVDTFGVEDVMAGQFTDHVAGFVCRRVGGHKIVQANRAGGLVEC